MTYLEELYYKCKKRIKEPFDIYEHSAGGYVVLNKNLKVLGSMLSFYKEGQVLTNLYDLQKVDYTRKTD